MFQAHDASHGSVLLSHRVCSSDIRPSPDAENDSPKESQNHNSSLVRASSRAAAQVTERTSGTASPPSCSPAYPALPSATPTALPWSAARDRCRRPRRSAISARSGTGSVLRVTLVRGVAGSPPLAEGHGSLVSHVSIMQRSDGSVSRSRPICPFRLDGAGCTMICWASSGCPSGLRRRATGSLL